MDSFQGMAEKFRRFATKVSEKVGTHWAFGLALGAVLVWGATGPLFHYSDGWQLTINTATTIVTFLMVFLIQSTQNRDSRAVHLKLDELIRSTRRARNLFADLEDATEEELRALQAEFRKLRARASHQPARRHPGH
ncbi:MAG TPA: low affinity iron permease family protein [Myxococcaceae bacterium]